ncbi:MAG: alpha/beta fold hydrolase [Candidatus Dehalobacter alkaniphilus]|nr:alpha/beta fold hydrolase [Dehalobacter sp.]
MFTREELIKPFYFSGGSTAILLIHGFTACPIDMKPLGERLKNWGYTVQAPLLPGHGTSIEDLKKTSWQDWERAVAEAAEQLKKTCQRVLAIGHSMGGLLALSLAAQGRIDGAVSINAPIIYVDEKLHQAESLIGKIEYVGKPHKTAEISLNSEGIPHFSYIQVPVISFISLNQAIERMKGKLPQISCPTLMVQSMADGTVHPSSGEFIQKSIGDRYCDAVYWKDEDHYLPLSAARDELAQKIREFIEKRQLLVP